MARDETIEYLTSEDVLGIHEVIVESNTDTEPGVSSRGDVEYAVEFVREGHFGRVPKTIHEKAFQLLRLLVSNHPFVDGNKRTALASTTVFYALNGRAFEYDREMKTILKAFATDSEAVDREEVLSYLRVNMATDESNVDSGETPSQREARRRLIRLLARTDIDDHEELYEELAHE